jgi:hypothetical protein
MVDGVGCRALLAASVSIDVNNKARPVTQQLIALRCLGQTGMRGADALTHSPAATMVGCKTIAPTFITEYMHAC